MLEVLEIKADNNTVRIVELENRKISITDDIAKLKLDSALFMTIKDHIDYVVADATLKVKCDLTSTGIINGHQLNLAYGDYYIKSIPTVGDMGYVFLIGSDINDIVLLEWNPLDNTLNIKSNYITLNGSVNITETTYLNKLKFGNQLDPITGVTYSFSSTINDNTIPTSLKVQNMINAISQFNPNDSTLTGTTTLSNIKFPTGSIINGFVNSTQNLNNDNTVPTSLRVKNMIDAIPIFNPVNTILTGQTDIVRALIGKTVIISDAGIFSLPGLRFRNSTYWMRRFVISTESVYNDESILSALKVKNMIDAIPIFNPNNTNFTGLTEFESFKIRGNNEPYILQIVPSTGDLTTQTDDSLYTSYAILKLIESQINYRFIDSSFQGITRFERIGGMHGSGITEFQNDIDTLSSTTVLTSSAVQKLINKAVNFILTNGNFDEITTSLLHLGNGTVNDIMSTTSPENYDDNLLITAAKVKSMVDAIPTFNPNNLTLTGETNIKRALIGSVVVISNNGIVGLPSLRFRGQTDSITKFYLSNTATYDDDSVLSGLKIKNMIDAIPVFNPNNLTLTGITSAEQFKLKYGGIIDTIVGTCDLMEINNESIFTTAMVMDLIEQSAFISDNTVLTGITTVSQIKMDKGGYTIKTMPTTGAPGEYNMRIECTTDNSFLIDWNNWDSTAIMKCNDLIFDGAVNNIGTTTLNSLKFGNQLTPINAVSYSTNTTIDDNTLATSKRAQNLAFPVGICVKFISTQSISTLPGTWTRVGIWGTKSPLVLFSITIRTIYLGNTARVTFIPVNPSTAASRAITFDQMGIINGATFYSDDFELVGTNEYSFHNNQTKMTYSTNQFTVDWNNARSWSVTFSFNPSTAYSYASSVQYEYQRTA